MKLRTVQRQIASNWVKVYRRLFKSTATTSARPLYVKAAPKGVISLGGFHPLERPTLRAAIRALGTPTGMRGGGVECKVRWSDIGLLIYFVNFGGSDACEPDGGLAQAAIIKPPNAGRWRTDRGLQIGSGLARLPQLYPAAPYHSGGYYPHSWWLVVGRTVYGAGCPCPQPVLRAKLNHRRVSSLRLWIGSAGD